MLKPATSRDATTAPADERPARPSSGRVSWALAALAGAFASIAALADLGRWAGDELVGVDPLTFHLPNIGRWIQNHSMWQIDQFVPLLAHGNYPNNGDVVLLSTVLPWHNDFLVRLPITFFLLRPRSPSTRSPANCGAPHAAAALGGVAVISLPVVGIATIPRALPDSLMWTTFACGLLFLLRHVRIGRRSDLVLAGLGMGIAAGTKWYGVSSVAVVVVDLDRRAVVVSRRRPAGDRAGATCWAMLSSSAASSLLGVLPWLAPQPRALGQPGLPAEGRAIRHHDLRRAARRHPRPGGLPDLGLLRRRARAVAARGRDDRGARSGRRSCAALAIAAALLLARRRGGGPDARVLVFAVGVVVLGVLYTFTPATALGLKDDPSLAHANTRYAVPGADRGRAGRRLGGRAPAAARRAHARGRARRRRAARRVPRLRGPRDPRRRARRGRPRRARRAALAAVAAARAARSCSSRRRSPPRSSASPPPTASRTASTTVATATSTRPSTRCSTRRRAGAGSAWRATGRSAACRRSGRRSARGSATRSSTSGASCAAS